jgi:hypothetical protein
MQLFRVAGVQRRRFTTLATEVLSAAGTNVHSSSEGTSLAGQEKNTSTYLPSRLSTCNATDSGDAAPSCTTGLSRAALTVQPAGTSIEKKGPDSSVFHSEECASIDERCVVGAGGHAATPATTGKRTWKSRRQRHWLVH